MLKLNSTDYNDQENGIKDDLEFAFNGHIQGRPGSGKTSLVKKFIINYCNKLDRLFWFRKIPVYIKYSSGNIFHEILGALNQNKYFKNSDHFTVAWLKEKLIKGKFLIFIDDVHNILNDKTRRENSKIDTLIEYKKNTFILISRDYFSACPFHFRIYEMQGLSDDREKSEEILKIHTDKSIFQNIWMHLGHGYKTDLLKLYNTPQQLKLLARVFDQKDRFDDNKSLLFRRFLVSRHGDEEKKPNESLPLELKERILAAVAYGLFVKYQESAYSVPYYTFREVLNQSAIQINEKYGFSNDSDSILEGLLTEGYLIKIDDKIQYEHDQWQEFFTALEIHQKEYSIKYFLTKNFGKEISLFVSGLYRLEDEIKKRKFWKSFWADISLSDFFLTDHCLKNKIRYTVGEAENIYKDYSFDEDEIISSYKDLGIYYEKIILQHLPNLREKFKPKGLSQIGVLVEKNKKNIGYRYGYRPITPNHSKKVILIDKYEIQKQLSKEGAPDNLTYYQNE